MYYFIWLGRAGKVQRAEAAERARVDEEGRSTRRSIGFGRRRRRQLFRLGACIGSYLRFILFAISERYAKTN